MSSLVESATQIAQFGDFDVMSEDGLLAAQRLIALHSRSVDAVAARAAAAIVKLSAPELGHSGLAARHGFRSPVELIEKVSGVSRIEARKLVSAGHSEVVATAGLDAVDAVNRGLGKPDAAISAERLAQERAVLFDSGLTPEQLFRRAREIRDELDATAVEQREKQQRDQRYWKNFRRADGMVAGSYLLAPEDGALLSSAFQTLLSPRRGGPRFVDASDPVVRASEDPRTDEQFAADGLVAMIDVAVNADAGRVFPSKKPAVRVIVREIDLASRSGRGLLADSRDSISIDSVERIACSSGLIGIRFDEAGQVIDIGRTQRLHTAQQRIGIGVRDGGCMAPDCGVPASMTEVHHPNHWDRDHGETSVSNGISLCRFHHMMAHNNHWEIQLVGGVFWWIPPVKVYPEQVAVRLVSKNPLLAGTSLSRTG